jgi:hypothetical protein
MSKEDQAEKVLFFFVQKPERRRHFTKLKFNYIFR